MMRSKYDLVIAGGNIIRFDPDRIDEGLNIGVNDGKIAAITGEKIRGEKEIDACGKYVAPGFIDFHSHVNGRLFSAKCLLRQGVTTTIGGERIFDPKVMRDIETEGFIINHGFYISCSFTLRKAVGLHDPRQKATKQQINSMIKLAKRFFEFGVLGIHFSLEYAPGTQEEELESLFHLAREYDKIVMVHLRKDGYEAIESLDEIIRVSRKTKAKVHILHVMYTAGLDGVLDEFLEKINMARQEGCDITADTGVYSAYPTFSGSESLHSAWASGYGDNISEKNLMISSGVHAGKFCDKKFFSYIRKEFPTTLITAFVYEESQIEKAIKPEYIFISTNAAYGPHHDCVGHPESSGTFPKLISRYVRDKKILPLTTAIKKAAAFPAKRIGIPGKGAIEPGYDADIMIFDMDKIKANSNYVGFGNPNAEPDGVDYVMVAGEVIKDFNGQIMEDKYYGEMIKEPRVGVQDRVE